MADAVHRIALLLLFLVTLQCGASLSISNPLTRRDDDPTVDAFDVSTELCRIWGSTSVLVNSTLYIDGGEVTVQRCDEGQTSNCTTWSDINNYVFAIPFDQPISDISLSSLPYKTIKKSKSAPLTLRGVLWRNKLGSELYTFGGGTIGNSSSVNYNATTSSRISRFSAESGSWSDLAPASSNAWDLQYCSVPSLDKSFAFGSWGGSGHRSTMMALDSGKSPEVSTLLDPTDIPSGDYSKGAMMHLPVQGGDGVLLFIGGSVTPVAGAVDGSPDVPMNSVRIYDIAGNQWYNQSTSTDTTEGIFPNPRHSFCAVLASTGTDSFDIFMYGGDFNTIESKSYSTGLWILSIPSFRWFYFPDPDTRTRLAGVTCQVVGSHFIRWGGWNYYSPKQAQGPTCLNAMSIFNLNTFTWTDEFDPKAGAYESPEKVKTWNSQHESPLSGWGTGVQELFAGLNMTTTTNSTNSTNSSSTASPNTSATSTPIVTSSSRLPKLLGGILGGLAVLILILGGILVLIKRKKRRDELASRFELAAEVRKPNEMPLSQPMAELPGGYTNGYRSPVDMKQGGSQTH